VDLLGLETGVDLAAGSGSLESLDPPGSSVPSNFATDTDTDPTLGWLMSTVAVEEASVHPERPSLTHPMPYRAGSRMRFDGAFGESITLMIVDAAGRRVRTLFEGVVPTTGLDLRWDGHDAHDRPAPAGVYFVHATGEAVTSRLVLMW
jgi:hypothetical protein